VADPSRLVGFLDAPDTGVEALAQAVRDAFGVLGAGAVVTVFSDRLTSADVATLCRRCAVELLATIAHPAGGTTFTLSVPADG
jgi:hypothetical protein